MIYAFKDIQFKIMHYFHKYTLSSEPMMRNLQNRNLLFL